jgi:hypothetical protein
VGTSVGHRSRADGQESHRSRCGSGRAGKEPRSSCDPGEAGVNAAICAIYLAFCLEGRPRRAGARSQQASRISHRANRWNQAGDEGPTGGVSSVISKRLARGIDPRILGLSDADGGADERDLKHAFERIRASKGAAGVDGQGVALSGGGVARDP